MAIFNISKKISKKQIIITIFIIITIIIIFTFYFIFRPIQSNIINISNLNECGDNIHNTISQNITASAYNTVKLAHNFNNQPSLNHYSGLIREGSCSTTTEDNIGHTSMAILDIPDAKQSWQIEFFWIKNNQPTESLDFGAIKYTCITEDQMIYPDFNCDKIIAERDREINDNIINKDPIFNILPYSTLNYTIRFASVDEKDKITLNITISISNVEYKEDPEKYVNLYKNSAIDYLKSRGFNPDNYSFNYIIQYP